jgi:hypothetical protein
MSMSNTEKYVKDIRCKARTASFPEVVYINSLPLASRR